MTATTTRNPLDSIRIASPCTADWSNMQGDDKKRFCSECKLHVHDISAMSTDEALDLLRAAGKNRLCVRLHRRSDGTVLTQDCPRGLRRRLRWAWARAAALISVVLSAAGCGRTTTAGGADPVTPATTTPEPRPMGEVEFELGDMIKPAKPPEVHMGLVAEPTPDDPRD
jgi:hypothetical protein